MKLAEWNQAQAMRLLQLASKQLGIPADELQRQLQTGDLGKLPGAQAASVKQAMQDPQMLRQMLSTPQAQQLLRQLKQK